MRQTLQLRVEGMSCGGCEQRLGTALRRLDGVVEATPDHRSAQVEVVIDPARCDRGAVVDRIETGGYQVIGPAGGHQHT